MVSLVLEGPVDQRSGAKGGRGAGYSTARHVSQDRAVRPASGMVMGQQRGILSREVI